MTDTGKRAPICRSGSGREPVASVAADELSSWLETAYLLRSPANARRLLAATERAVRGEGDAMNVGELRARLGLDKR